VSLLDKLIRISLLPARHCGTVHSPTVDDAGETPGPHQGLHVGIQRLQEGWIGGRQDRQDHRAPDCRLSPRPSEVVKLPKGATAVGTRRSSTEKTGIGAHRSRLTPTKQGTSPAKTRNFRSIDSRFGAMVRRCDAWSSNACRCLGMTLEAAVGRQPPGIGHFRAMCPERSVKNSRPRRCPDSPGDPRSPGPARGSSG
jgi:hypothetical protein